MRHRISGGAVVAALLAGGLAFPAVAVRADATTASADTYRTGWDANEPGLSPASVASSDFGQQFSTQLESTVQSQIYAQPIVANGTLIAATETNNVYGLDPATGAVRWTVNLGTPWPASVTVPGNSWSCNDMSPDGTTTPVIGITSTPVYDPATGYVYLTSKVDGGVYHESPKWFMHAVNPATGAEKSGFPVQIAGSPSNDPSLVFDPVQEAQRPGLLLLGGVVYAGFGSLCDAGNWRGYVAGVSTAGKQTALWSDVAGSGSVDGGGIWASGAGLVADGSGHIFFATGNNGSPPVGAGSAPPSLLGESVVRLNVNSDGSLSAGDFFSPSDANTLDTNDRDLGSGGPMALPDSMGTASIPHLMVESGKDGRIFLLNRDNLGGRGQGAGGTDAVVQTLGPYQGCYCHPAAWPGDGGYIYYPSNGGPLTAFKYGLSGSGQPSLAAVGHGAFNYSYLCEGSPLVTSTGTTSDTAVVWATRCTDQKTGSGSYLVAYNAIPNADGSLTQLYATPLPNLTKFNMPATDGGRVYVATRTGKILAFGRPASSALTGSPVNVGNVNVGATGTGTLTVQSTKALNITAITTSAPFAATAPALPYAMAAGATLSVPVSFTPTAAGNASGIITLTTDSGSIGFAVAGNGVKPGLTANPTTVSFSNQPTGVPKSATIQFTNTGTATETVTAETPPAAPYSTGSTLPAIGTTIAAGASVNVSVTYSPTVAGTDTSSLSITSTSGTVTVPLSGTAVTGQGHLTITPTTLAFGNVTVGTASQPLSFTVTNDGNIPVTITKAKAVAGDFFTTAPIAEGTQISPDQSLSVPITFKPSIAGAESASYEITGDTGQGENFITMTGTGVTALSAPPTNWKANGTATVPTAGTIQLTAATASAAGSAFYASPVATDGLTASFTAQMNGGTGGDGLAFALVDSTKGTASGLGAPGGGIGFAGLPGLDVALVSSWNGGTKTGNFIGLAATGAYAQSQTYFSWVKAPSNLRTGTHTVGITIGGGHVKVSLDGAQLLDAVPTAGVLPANAYVGFTGSTGGSTDVHAVSGITITPPAATTGPQPLTPSPTSVAFGNVTTNTSASQSVVLTNNGTATETVSAVTAPTGGFSATLPSVGTAVAVGASVTVPVSFSPTISGAQNSTFAVTTTSGTVTVSLSGTGQVSSTKTLPGFADGTWTANGSATITGTGAAATATLTTDGVTGSAGSVVNSTPVNPVGLTATFTATISGAATSGADGMTFALYDASATTKNSVGGTGGGLGVSGLPAVFVALDTFGTMGIYGSSNFCAIGTSTASAMTALASNKSIPVLRNGGAHTIGVTVTSSSHIVVSIDGTQVMDAAVTLPPSVLVAFTGGTGSLTDTHTAANPVVTYVS